MSTQSDIPLHYVILGAGAAGTLLALELSKITSPSFRITLIDNKDFHEFTPSIINVLLQPTTAELRSRLNSICPLLAEMFKDTRVEVIKGVIKSVTTEEVILQDTKVPYTHLAICTGSSYSAPYKLSLDIETVEQRYDDLLESRNAIESTESILCIGGGPVGVEMVGELAARYPEKSITLVHSKPELLEKIPGNLGADAKASFEEEYAHKAVVKVILDEKALPSSNGDGSYVTSKTNQELHPGHVIFSRGIAPNSEFMTANFPDCLDDQKYIRVDEFFQVLDQTNIYAIGDVSNNPDPKLFFTAHMQAMHLCKNINAQLSGKQPAPYKGSRISYAVSLGPEVGLLSFSDGILTIRGVRRMLFKKARRGSRLAMFSKHMIEKVSLTGLPASAMNNILYYTTTK
ncbi:hypothetical protein DSO57_1033992 [Entomophthora muscae]|uniref:Uncharacterized protein n=1 Tax=Entomophthora muscae TaxID=34485 RepID=A0ACC2TAY2_9FUNG|nr:hypothetical protein DSO57_1033992 [Entomophthora muscae]